MKVVKGEIPLCQVVISDVSKEKQKLKELSLVTFEFQILPKTFLTLLLRARERE